VKQRLNFSPTPFRERAGRLTLLWVLNGVLLVGLAMTIWTWLEMREANRASHRELATLRTEQRELAAAHGDLVDELESVDLTSYRQQLELFHGIQTAFETNWGRLLDDLSALMNEDVRLTSLRPGRNRDQEATATLIYLAGEARNKDAQLNLIRTLQEDPSFADVRFASERYETDGEVKLAFEISFRYRARGGGS